MATDPHPGAPPPAGSGHEARLAVVEERLELSKRRVAGATVRVSTRTETVEEVAEVEVESRRVEIARVPVGRVVDEVPAPRTEGDVTVVPVVEERFVVVRQLFLREELHIRQVVEREVRREPVVLRRQHATVERLPPRGEGNAEP